MQWLQGEFPVIWPHKQPDSPSPQLTPWRSATSAGCWNNYIKVTVFPTFAGTFDKLSMKADWKVGNQNKQTLRQISTLSPHTAFVMENSRNRWISQVVKVVQLLQAEHEGTGNSWVKCCILNRIVQTLGTHRTDIKYEIDIYIQVLILRNKYSS